MAQLYRIINKSTLEETSDTLLKVGTVEYSNPSPALLHKLGYWPLGEVQEEPEAEDGYKVFDDGYAYKDDGDGGKVVTRTYRKLRIVDPGYPQIERNQVIAVDRWDETDTEYIHVVEVYDIVDEKPDIDESAYKMKEKTWELDAENKRKVAHYVYVRKVDGAPALEEGQEFVEDYWIYTTDEETGEEIFKRQFKIMNVVRNTPELQDGEVIDYDWFEDDEETNTRTFFYKVVKVVDNPPTLAENQEIVDRWPEYDEETNTRTWKYRVRTTIDNPPTLEEGQEIVDRWIEDNPDEGTRTWHYEVRKVVDNRPDLAENEHIEAEWWDDDGVTRIHRYEVHRYIDEAPVLAEGQDIMSDHWDVDNTDPYFIVHTRVYEVRNFVDAGAPELDEAHFVYADYWNDDGVNYTHVYDVWELKDDPRPDVNEDNNRVIDLGEVDDTEAKTRGKKWLVKPIVRNKPDDDPDGNFKWVEDHEVDKGSEIEIIYRKVIKVWRRISKLKLEAAAFQMGILEKYDAYIDSIEITNEFGQKVSARRFYDQANDLLESHPLFKPYYMAGLAAMGLTEAQGDALLDQCVVDPTES